MKDNRLGYCITVLFLLALACSSETGPKVSAYAEGTLTIRVQEDSTKDYSGFEVFLASQADGDIDTLAIALTDREGYFSMDISADEEGVYPLMISRAGVTLAVEEYVLVDGDSSTITGAFPLDGRRLRIVSMENAAWTAYRNVKLQHTKTLLLQIQNQDASVANQRQVVLRTSTILWSLRTSYPSTTATDLASVESVVMMEGWNDLLVVERMQELRLHNQSIVEAVRAARRSTARLFGQDSSLAMIRSYIDRLTELDQKAALHAEIVIAYADSAQNERAVSEALELRRLYPDTEWANWASTATYELENLRPGMTAPAFAITSIDGDLITTESLRGKFIILEFYEPTDDIFLKELAERNAVFSALNPNVFKTLSISLDPDSILNTALFEERRPPGLFSIAPAGRDAEIARKFNIQIIPTRILIDPNGRIIDKYPGSAMLSLEDDLVAIINRLNQAASTFD